MEKEFCTYEQAVALKELGFNESCFGYYIETKEWIPASYSQKGTIYPSNLDLMKEWVSAPLYQQAFRWFRDKHNLYSTINLDSYKEPYSLKVTIKHLDDTNTFVDKEYYPYNNGIGDIDNKKYEEAESACLDKLIENCKNK